MMTTSFLATRTKHVLPKRRRRGPASPRYDELRILREATKQGTYLVSMPLPDDAKSRDEIFMDWIGAQIRDLKAHGVSRTAAAEKGQVSRNQTYEWEGRGQKGFSRPKPETIKTFCVENGLDWKVPFRILGYDTSGRSHEELTRPESETDRRVRLLRLAIDRPGIKPEERRELEIQLVRMQAAQRMNEDAIKAADEALRRHKAD